MNQSYLELIEKRVPLIFDGAMGTQIQKANPPQECFGEASGCNEILNVTCPEVIISIHEEYLRAGANVIETNTFGGSQPKLREYGLDSRVYEINRAGALAARTAVQNCITADRSLFVCGSMGPTGFLPSSSDEKLSAISFMELADIFETQAEGLVDGGADLLLIETSQDLLEVRAALYGIRRLFRKKQIELPVQVQITVDGSGRMLLGSSIEAFLGAVSSLRPSVLGLNCGTGPDEVMPTIRKLLQLSPFPVSLLPNAGKPENVDGKAVYRMKPDAFSAAVVPLVTEEGLAVAGGCCGTTPEHIAALASRLAGARVAQRASLQKTTCWVSTGIGGTDLETINRPIIIGERLNTQGSKKTKELVLSRNYDELFQIALEQSRRGSALLDICVAISERDDESVMMSEMVGYLSDRLETPLCIDSTEPAVMYAALQKSPGSVMLNSINLEYGGKKADEILALARDYGCPVVALTIDDDGMAKTVERKLEIANKLRDLACGRYGLPGHLLYIDTLVFTLATGDPESAHAALTSLEAIRRIKQEMPEVRTAMGVSNVSYGLKPKARRILNNLMLHHALEAGLDAAIFNPLHVDSVNGYDPEIRSIAEDLLFNRNPDALSRFVACFEGDSQKQQPNQTLVAKAELPAHEKLRNAVLQRDRRELSAIINELLQTRSAMDILNGILLPAMGDVGERMSSGEMILPFVLQAAEVMKEAVAILEPSLKSEQSVAKGKIVLATVYGDVHDIGKNLVGSILRNQGYEIIDLGKQVPLESIIEVVRQEKPDAVGLSALLVTTSRQMALCVAELAKEGMEVPVLIGGAAVNRDYASRISVLPDGARYAGGVHYAKDAFEATKILEKRDVLHRQAEKKADIKTGEQCIPDQIPAPVDHLEPPFWGTGEMLLWDTEQLLDSIDRERLFKAGWGGGKLSPEAYETAKKEHFEPAFEKIRSEILQAGLIDARGYYGYFPVITDGEQLILLDPSNYHAELVSFHFPRMPRVGCRSLTDYFRPDGDTLGVQVVTIGRRLGDRCREFFQGEQKYSYGFFLNALGTMLVENLAERVSNEMRRGLGLERGMGRRYSFGYPGMPSLEEQKKLFEVIGVEERLGITLTEGFQMDPEHSTIGIFVHHPQAEYLF